MSKSKLDLTGQRFGSLVAVSRADDVLDSRGVRKGYWNCVCDCGNTTVVPASDLVRGHTKSCGHRRGEFHGLSKTPMYFVWKTMKQRCYNPNDKKYKDYGARGISICDEWLQSFGAFHDWAEQNGYQRGLSIDRINVDGNYEPSNCRWATDVEQANNKRPRSSHAEIRT